MFTNCLYLTLWQKEEKPKRHLPYECSLILRLTHACFQSRTHPYDCWLNRSCWLLKIKPINVKVSSNPGCCPRNQSLPWHFILCCLETAFCYRQLTFLLSSQLCLQNTRGPQLNCKIDQIKPNFQIISLIILLKIIKSSHKAVLDTFLKVFIGFWIKSV